MGSQQEQRRLLSLDGGGIMGMISLQFLKRMETQLREQTGASDDFRLCDFFDYIGGTSTGAIIAAALSLGMSVDEIIEFYRDSGEAMFTRAPLHRRLWYGYDATPLSQKLQTVIGTKTVGDLVQSGDLKTLLLVVMKNVSTDSPWPITSNINALFNDPHSDDSNLGIPLWQLVRASTAAPTFFRPEAIRLGEQTFQFVDGGVTPYNNPSFLLFKQATLPEYRLQWATGVDRLMLVSVGTGLAYSPPKKLSIHGRSVIANAATLTADLIRSFVVENDINCRTVGHCVHGREIDLELNTMTTDRDNRREDAQFLYARYDADISQAAFKEVGIQDIGTAGIKLDSIDRLDDLVQIGQAFAEHDVDFATQFAPFVQSFKPQARP